MSIRLPIPILRFWASRDMPFTHGLLARAGVWRHNEWRNARMRSRRLRWSGCRVRLDLRDYHQRAVWFLGRLMDVPVQLFIREALRPGDLFVDAGANIGILTLLGARVVGPSGGVVAIEPNPDVYRRLREHVESNSLMHVRTAAVAISDRAGELTLSVPPTGNTGAGSLEPLAPRHAGRAHASYRVPVRVGDELLADAPPGPMVLKIDVEGHEPRVLRGLEQTIRARAPAIILELNAEMLAGAGSGPADVLAWLRDRGYSPYLPGATWSRWRRRWTLRLDPAPPGWNPRRTVNAVLLVPGGEHERRVRPYLTRRAR